MKRVLRCLVNSGLICCIDLAMSLACNYVAVKPILAISIIVTVASSLLAKEKPASLPPPVSDKTYTFEQIEKQKAELKDKVVRIEIKYLLGEPSDLLGDGTQRYIVKDTSKGGTPYGQVAFLREGLEKMGLANDPHREGPFVVYALVHVFCR